MYIYRTMEAKLKYLSAHFPIVMVCGARQVGKTTLLNQIKKDNEQIQYVTLDYPRLRSLAREDPELFLQQYQTPLIIDEIQYAPELLPYLKIRSDLTQQNGLYYLTGSQMFHMMKNVSESLAGRVGILSMYSLSKSEIEGREAIPFRPDTVKMSVLTESVADIFEKIYRGGMPKMIADKSLLPEDYFGAYMQTYLERDIRDLITVKDENKFLKFISCAAGIDISEESISWANELSAECGDPPKFHCVSLFEYTAEPQSFDLILDSGCFHHIKPHRREQYLTRVQDYLKDDGYFLMTCFNLDGGANVSDYDVYRDRSMHGGLGFSEHKIKKILENYFRIIEFRKMKESSDPAVFGKDFMWVILMKKK